jgi:hypothetical protein
MMAADLLFLPMHDLRAGGRAGLVPGKTYEYLASGRPILAAVPDGDARDILAEAGGARICSPSDVGEMTRIIADQASGKVRGELLDPPDPGVVGRYERRCQAAELARLFETVTGQH